jgi:AcrR family transcriptional regulator
MSNSARVEPQQERATRRLANFLDVAALLFAEIGYEATTMTAIAERSGSGIGTLYHYFQDKQSMAFALLNQYAQEVEAYWKPLIEQAETLSELPQPRTPQRSQCGVEKQPSLPVPHF